MTGWMTASLIRFASHSSASDASGAAPRACRSSSSLLAASSASLTKSVEGETISRKCARRPAYVFWSYRVPEGSKGGVEDAMWMVDLENARCNSEGKAEHWALLFNTQPYCFLHSAPVSSHFALLLSVRGTVS